LSVCNAGANLLGKGRYATRRTPTSSVDVGGPVREEAHGDPHGQAHGERRYEDRGRRPAPRVTLGLDGDHLPQVDPDGLSLASEDALEEPGLRPLVDVHLGEPA